VSKVISKISWFLARGGLIILRTEYAKGLKLDTKPAKIGGYSLEGIACGSVLHAFDLLP
jgi:hypothetical protein